MIQIKKTILTLALLITAATGAWAQGPVDGTIAWSVGNEASATVSASIKDAISSTGVTTGSGLTVSTGKYFNTEMMRYQPATANAGNVSGVMIEYTIEAVDGYKFKPTGVDYAAVKDGSDNISYSWSYTIDGVESAITDVSNTSVLRNTGNNSATAQLMHSESITADGCSVFTLRFYISNCSNTKKICIGNITISGSVSAAPAPSGPEVAWDKATKTGTFTMPGGNVTLEPEYYPQATVAEGAVTAADADARATTDDPLVKVDATKLTGAKKLMYFVSNSGTTAPAYDAEGWTDQLPTAEGFTQQGIVYVWYYPVGTDEGVDGATATYSDGDMNATALTVTIAAEPTYAVTFAEGTDPNEWTASPAAGVKKGQTVTVTYSGTKKVIGVKAEKKAKAIEEPVADIVWDGTNVSDLHVEGNYLSYTKEGIKLSGNAEQVQAEWNNSAYLGTPGMEFITMESGGFTFTAPTGKAFTKIEMKAVGDGGWATENLGTGWAFNAKVFTVTWTGSAASTVKLLKDADMFSGDFISSIAFYLSE